MNKIVFLLFASLVCANAAPLTLAGGDVSALTDIMLTKIMDINVKLFAVNNAITQLSADSTVLVPEDTESVAAIRTKIIRDVFDILDGIKTTEKAIAEVADDLKVLEDKFVAHCESAGALAGSSTAEIEADVALYTESIAMINDDAQIIYNIAAMIHAIESLSS